MAVIGFSLTNQIADFTYMVNSNIVNFWFGCNELVCDVIKKIAITIEITIAIMGK